MNGSTLYPYGILTRILGGAIAGLLLAGIALGTGFLCPLLWLLVPVFLVGGPFIWIGYTARGQCPYCGNWIEVQTRRGGTCCRACRHGVMIADGRLWRT